MRRLRIFLVGILLLTIAALTATLVLGNQPILGLDLQGGVSVVLAPVGNPNSDSLDVAVDIIRNRVDALGVAEPEISRQGKNIVVDLPGVQDRDKAVLLVGQTAELRFRSVLAELPPESSSSTTTTTTTPGSTTTTTPATGTETTTSTTTPESAAHAAALDAIAKCDDQVLSALPSIPTTNRARDQRGACVVLPVRKTGNAKPSRLYLAPVNKVAGVDAPEGLTGDDVKSAKSSFQSGVGYVVDMKLKPDGAKKFDAMASTLFGKSPPTDQVAIALDSVVQSHPQFQTSSFSGDVQISGGFTAQEADDLAKLITYGALPVTLERLTTQSISPSLGKDQLRAGLAAGLIGLALVGIYMLFYYRILGLVVILGLAVSGTLIYCLISYLGKAAGLTLTIAGVTGLIVSVGVTVDSYVVYYERLKDEVRSGRSVRSSIDRGFQKSFRTIIAADLVSLLGAGVLYFLAIGSVRGFAFFLGLSTTLDLLVAYFLMYPLVAMMARRPTLVRMRHFGMAAALDVPRSDGMSAAPNVTTEKRRRHTLGDIFHERTHFEFIERSWRWALISGTAVVISLLALGIRGLNLGIDFQGGTQWQVTVGAAKADTAAIRDVMSSAGVANAKVLIIGGDQVRVQAEELRSAERLQVRAALADYAGVDAQEVSVTNVGPTWGKEVTKKAGIALVVFFGLIAVYLSWRFEWRMAGSAIVAVIHDIIITAGVYAITQIEVVPATVVAFLTILGFSLYDTVVVFDKVRENEATIGSERGDTYSRMVNRSMNQVLMRSLNTSFVAVLPVFSLLIVGSYLFGALTLRDFALALTVGLITGAYSSIFVATPILAWLKEREPRYIALRERSATQLARERSGGAPVPRAPAAAAASAARAAAPSLSVAEPIAGVPAVPIADAPVDPVGDLPAEPDGGATAPPEAVPAPAPPADRPEPGPVVPRPRQQRGKKRR